MDSDLLYFKMQMLQAEIEMNGMIAENRQREIEDGSISYVEKDFMNLIEKYNIQHNAFPFYKG